MDPHPSIATAHLQFAQHQHALPAIAASHWQPIITNSDTSHHLLPPPPYHHPHDAPLPSREVEEELGSHDSLLEYINSILMDDSFEDSSWQQLLGNTNGGMPTNRADGLDDNIANKYLSSSLSPLNDRYQHIFRGFHEILDASPPLNERYQHIFGGFHEILDEPSGAESLPRFIDADTAGYEVIGEDLGSGGKEAIPEGLYQQQPGWGGNVDAFMYHPASAHIGKRDEASSIHEKAELPAPNILLDQHNVDAQHTALPTIIEAAPNAHTNGLAANALVGNAHAHVNGHRSSLSGNLVKAAGDGDVSLVRNADLPAELYAQLFDEWPSGVDEAYTSSRGMPVGGTRPKRLSKEDAALRDIVDLKGLMLTSAKAAGEGNVKRAMEILQQVQQQGASPYGSGLQRAVHYFSEALVARLSGMGSTLYKAVANTAQLPSPLMMIKVYKMMFEVCPYVKIGYHFANQYILKVASGASRLHIVDYGIMYGFQWPCLIYALAHRPEGPPFIRITGIEFPANPADINPKATTEGTSCRLSEYAQTYNVPFQYRAISASKWHDIDPSLLYISPDEVLVLNSFNRLGHLHDESIAHPSPRDQLLKQMRALNPQLLVIGSVNATHSSPCFAPRFKEAFLYYYNMFDVLYTTLSSDRAERVVYERELMGQAILNVVACEGTERTEIPENFKQWQARIKRAGFQQLPIIPSVMRKAQDVMKRYHKDFSLLHDSNRWMLLGWRGRSMQAMSAWEPIR